LTVRTNRIIGPEIRPIERIEETLGIYEGELRSKEKHGTGCYLWYNGNFYNGEWQNNKMTGAGTLYYANGGILKGKFVDGKINGLGRGLYENGDMYVGMWKDAMFHGTGLFYMKDKNQWQMGDFELGSMTQVKALGKGKPSSLGYIKS